MGNLITSFILGLSAMFFGMTSWLFFRKGGRLAVIVASLMTLLGTQCFISIWFILKDVYLDEHYWKILTCIDIVAVPFYAIILRELVRPGSVSWKVVCGNLLPFFAIATLYVITRWKPFYLLMIAGTSVYGTSYLLWTSINIGRYNRKLKEQYSFTEDINLNWLRLILYFFFALLCVWIADTMLIHADMDCFYLTASMTMWMVIDYFIYKHETVMESLNVSKPDSIAEENDDTPLSELGTRIEKLFAEDRIFLNHGLKISDVAAAVGSNRTYVSNYFNREASTTFYDYVNALRIEYACTLLTEGNESIKVIAEQSGYNSPQAFIRVFTKVKGISPSDFRKLYC